MTIFYIFLIILIVLCLITGIIVTVIEKRGLNVVDDVEFQKTKVFEIIHENNNESQVKDAVENKIEPQVEEVKKEVVEEIEILDIDEEIDIPVIEYSEVVIEDNTI